MFDINYYGSFDDPSGYGAVARGYASSLIKLDNVRLKLSPHNFFQGKSVGFSNKHVELLRTKLDGNKFVIQHFTPNVYKLKDGTNIGYSVWELDRIPRGWIRKSNMMKEMWVPSAFAAKAFEAEGVGNVHIIPHGIDLDKFSPETEPLLIRNKAGFNFLSIFQWNYRKGYDVLLKAYL